jgi:hypothetical protein
LDVAQHTEMVESELTRMIEKRHDQRAKTEGERLEEELYAPSARAYQERQERRVRAQWYGYHMDQAERHRRTLQALIARHEGAAEKLLEDDGQEGDLDE